MTPLSRLRDSLLPDTDVRAALLCTYGLDPQFFEAEILPALLPTALGTDASAGSLSAYLYEADGATATSRIEVLYDHLVADGPQLFLGYRQIDLGGRAFHPKILIAEYEDRLRVVVASANLTRAGWTSLFELMFVDDLLPGVPHGWTSGLRSFVEATAAAAGGRGAAAERILTFLDRVGASGSTLHHSFDGPLIEAAFPAGAPTRVDVVSPFFEGEDGTGLFDQLTSRYPKAQLVLHLAASENEDGYVVYGPAEKLRALREAGAELRLIHSHWDDDDDRVPERRALHGKLLAVTKGGRSHVTVGSANATRAALLHPVAQGGNAELVVTLSCGCGQLDKLLPPSMKAGDRLTFSDVDPTGQEEAVAQDAAQWVEFATYSAKTCALTLAMRADSPPLRVTYGGAVLGTTHDRSWVAPLDQLGADAFVRVDAGSGPAIVPFVVLDPEYLAPRGTPFTLDLEGLADLLAGYRQLIHPPGEELPGHAGRGAGGLDTPTFGKGAIPWRRILAGLDGLGQDLVRQFAIPDAVRWTLANPLRLGGLRARFAAAHEAGRFLDGDFAFALYETIRTLEATLVDGFEPQESAKLITATRDDVAAELDALLKDAEPGLRKQVAVLSRSEAGA